MISTIYQLITKFINTTILGFTFLCKLISRGFFFYISLPFTLLNHIFKKNKILSNIRNYFKACQEQPIYFLIVSLLILTASTGAIILKNQTSIKLKKIEIPIKNDTTNEIKGNITKDDTRQEEQISKNENIFAKYSLLDINNVNLKELRNINKDVFAWLSVDGTNINYPIVHTTNNEHYLKYNINQEKTTEGWPFMDYRNSKMMLDNNSIFYGHNLLNGTNFGSIAKIFKKDWFNSSNHLITLVTDSKKYTYEIFSCYETGDNVEYLENIFYSSEEYAEFLNKIKSKSKYDFKVDITSKDYIITLSTCKDDNTGRKVVHAKLIKSEYI